MHSQLSFDEPDQPPEDPPPDPDQDSKSRKGYWFIAVGVAILALGWALFKG